MAAPSGNQNAKSAKEWQQALRRAMAHKAEGDYRKTLDAIASVVVDKALDGDREAWQEIACREDGKPAQSVTIGGDPDNPFIQRIEEVIVDPADRSTQGV